MTYSIGIPTVNRPYRQQMFRRLVETGTLTHPLCKGFHLAYDRLPNTNIGHVMDQCIMDGTDWILLLEDDIEIVDDFLASVDRWLTNYEDPKVKFYPLGCGVRRKMKDARWQGKRAWQWPLKDFYGATAIAMRTEQVKLYRACMHENFDWMMPVTGFDENLKVWHTKYYGDYTITPVPCFVDHLGVETSQTMAEPHWTGSYVGFEGTKIAY